MRRAPHLSNALLVVLLATLASATGAAGCGSTVVDESPGGGGSAPSGASSGAGGSASSAGGSASGGGGTAPSFPCDQLALAGEPAWYEAEAPDDLLWNARFAIASNDSSAVALLFSRYSPPAQEGPPKVPIEHVVLSPWGDALPSGDALGAPIVTVESSTGGFEAASGWSGYFGVLHQGSAYDVRFRDDYLAGSAELFVDPAGEVAPAPARPLFAVRGPTGQLLGMAGDVPGAYSTSARFGALPPYPLGCATEALDAAAAFTAMRWIVATSSGGPFGNLGCEETTFGTPNQLQIGVFDLDDLQPTDTFAVLAPIAVRLAPRSDGAWLLFAKEAEPGYALALGRVDLDGKVVAGSVAPFALPDPPAEPGAIAVAGAGDHLALGWIGLTTGEPLLHLAMVAPDGAPESALTLPVALGSTSPALLASPDGGSVLFAWTTPGQGSRVFVARADCVQAP